MSISFLFKTLLFLKNDSFLLFFRDGLKLETELLDGKTKLILSPYGMLCYWKPKMLTFIFLPKIYMSLMYFLLIIE